MNRILLVIIFSAVVGIIANAQPTQKSMAELELGNEYFDVFAYRTAIRHYKKAFEEDTVTHDIKLKLAQSYYRMRDFEDAEYWSNLLIEGGYQLSTIELYFYIEILASNQHYHEAEYWFEQIKKREDVSPHQIKRLEGFLFGQNYSNIGENYWISSISINSLKSDFAPTYYKDGIVFLSSRTPEINIKKVLKSDGVDYLNLFFSERKSNGDYTKPVLFNKKVQSKYHEGPIAFYDNYTKIIFTQSNLVKRRLFGLKASKSKDGKVNLGLYIGDWHNDTITNVVPFKYNSPDYNCAHPTVSKDGKKMIFASSREDSYGGSDLYITFFKNGQWTYPKNLGNSINTDRSELFPFLNGNVLYFSSDGHPGLGGLDNYFTTLVKNEPTEIINPGYQINTAQDDFSLVSADGRTGYFASNRGNVKNDDIYFAEYHAPPTLKAQIRAIESKTDSIIHKPDIEVIDTLNKQSLIAFNTIGDSIFEYQPDTNLYYYVIINKQGYFNSDTILFSGNNQDTVLEWNIKLEKVTPFKPMRINNIYYDFDSDKLRDSSKIELNRVVVWLEKNPDVSIEIHSHSDSWGAEKYNMELSQRRAQSIVDYLVESGINKNRLVSKGFGETQPIVPCPNPNDCSSKDHQLNRRTEMMVIE